MNYETYLIDAIDMVASWELSEAEFAQAVNDQARLMAGLELLEFWVSRSGTDKLTSVGQPNSSSNPHTTAADQSSNALALSFR
jgi:hypothetical protein